MGELLGRPGAGQASGLRGQRVSRGGSAGGADPRGWPHQRAAGLGRCCLEEGRPLRIGGVGDEDGDRQPFPPPQGCLVGPPRFGPRQGPAHKLLTAADGFRATPTAKPELQIALIRLSVRHPSGCSLPYKEAWTKAPVCAARRAAWNLVAMAPVTSVPGTLNAGP